MPFRSLFATGRQTFVVNHSMFHVVISPLPDKIRYLAVVSDEKVNLVLSNKLPRSIVLKLLQTFFSHHLHREILWRDGSEHLLYHNPALGEDHIIHSYRKTEDVDVHQVKLKGMHRCHQSVSAAT